MRKRRGKQRKVPVTEFNCCCVYGAAVSGEWPEFQRDCCEIHIEDYMKSGDLCKRHAQERVDDHA